MMQQDDCCCGLFLLPPPPPPPQGGNDGNGGRRGGSSCRPATLQLVMSANGEFVNVTSADYSVLHLTRFVPGAFAAQVRRLLVFRNRFASTPVWCERFADADAEEEEEEEEDNKVPAASSTPREGGWCPSVSREEM